MTASRENRRRKTNRARRNFNLPALQGLELLEERAVPATFAVTSVADSGVDTLRWAIDQAAASPGADLIEFDAALAGQTIVLSSAADETNWGSTALVIVNHDVTIDGSDAPGLTISGDDAFRILGVGIGADVTLTNLTLADGYAKGGDGGGGGGGGAGLGGAIYVHQGTVRIENATLVDNIAEGGKGGGGFLTGGGGGAAGDSSGSTGGGPDGGLQQAAGGTNAISGLGGGGGGGTLSPDYFNGGAGGFGGGGGGGGDNGGGGGFGGGGGGGELFTGGSGGGFGGGSGSGFTADDPEGGGGAGMGGAIFNNKGLVLIFNSTLTANEAIGGSGGLYADAGQGLGAAVFNYNGNLAILNATFVANTASDVAQIYSLADGVSAIANVELSNTILADVASGTSATQVFHATSISDGTSFTSGVKNAVIGTATGFDGEIISAITDADLVALADNSGPTQTFLPGETSAVLNAGDTEAASDAGLTTDQRGETRYASGMIDLGSVQFTAVTEFTWDGGDADDALWSSPDNWVDDIAPTEGASLIFPVGADRLSNTNDFADNTEFGDITIAGAGYTLAGNIIDLTGDLFATYATGNSTISSGLRLVTSRDVDVADGGTLNLSGPITSTDFSQDLTKTGLGTLRFSGSVDNLFDDVFANEGTVALAMTSNANVNSSDLVVGDNTTAATVVFEADRQLWAGANVTVNEGSTLDLGVFDADISNLYLQGATVQIDTGGLLEIFIGVFSTATTNNVTSSIAGGGSLGQSGSAFAFNVAGDADVDIDLSVGVAVTGSIAVEKDGAGTLELSGANTFVSALNINAGVLLATSDGALGVSSTSSTYVDDGAALYFSGSNLAVSEQVYIAGTGIGGTGALRVVSGTTSLASGGNLAIYVLSAATIGADSGTTLNITGGLQTGFGSATPLTITNGATGRTILAANNTDFGGSLTLTEGYLRATQDNSFGSSGVSSTVTVEDGGTLELYGGITTPDTKSFVLSGAPVAGSAKIVNLDGDNTLSGGISYTDEQTITIANGTTLTLAGVIDNGGTGDDLNFNGNATGRAILSNSNAYGGDTNVLGGYLRATNDHAFGDPGSSLYVTAASGASIELHGGVRIPDGTRFVLDGLPVSGEAKLISLAGLNQIDGDIALSSNNQSILVDSESTLFLNGGISGSVDLDKNGLGELFLTGTSPFTGQFNVYEGPVYVNGSLVSASLVFVDGTLGGVGIVPNVSISGIGTLAPGEPEAATSTLTAGNVTLVSGSTYAVQLDGTEDYDQVVASGEIDLTGSTLAISLLTVPAIGDEFTIIVNDVVGEPVTGTFNGRAEGSTFTMGAVTFAITYVGGDGNDVVLTAIDVVYVWSGAFDEGRGWSSGQNWVGGVAPTPGSRLVFPSGPVRTESVNDFGSEIYFHSILIAGSGYVIHGNAITLDDGITATYTGNSSITADLILGDAVPFGVDVTDAATLVLGGGVSGSVGFEKTGGGRLVAGGGFTFPGYQVLGGTLIVNGSASGGGDVSVDGTLGGSGSVRFVTINAGGTLNPGDADAPATLVNAGASFNAEATFAVDLDGIGSYDRLLSFGGVDLNNAFLTVTLDATPRHGEAYTIIDVFAGFGSVTGTFAGLAEGATFTIGNVVFTISYVGGDGNDVVLTADVTYTWDGGDFDDSLWSSPDNWVGDIAPTEGARLVFPNGAQRKTNVNDLAPGFDVYQIAIQASGYTLTGNGVDLIQGVTATHASGTSRIDLPMLFLGNQVEISTGTLALGGALTEGDPANVTFSGPGVVILDGATANNLTSITTEDATLLLGKTPGVEAANYLNIGPGATLRYLADDQIRDAAYVTLLEDSYLDFNGFSDNFYVLSLTGSTVDIPEGSTFTLGYYIWSKEATQVSRINGPGTIDLNGASYVYTDDSASVGIDLILDAVLANGGVEYTYDYSVGTVAVTGANTYAGITYIYGNVRLENAQGLGATGNADDGYTEIYAYYGGQLVLAVEGLSLGEYFYLAGQDTSLQPLLWNVAQNATITGEIALYENYNGTTAAIGTADGTTLTLAGVVSEYQPTMDLLISNGATGRVVLAGDNTFTGTVDIDAGYLRLANDNALGDPTLRYAIGIRDGATLELTGGITLPVNKEIWFYGGPVAGAPKLASLAGDNTISDVVFFFADTTIDAAEGSTLALAGGLDDDSEGYGFTKTGAGTLVLGDSDYTGSTLVAAGTLLVEGDITNSSDVTVAEGAVLGGTGLAPATDVLAGGTIAPGIEEPGHLATGDLELASNAHYTVEIFGPTSDDYDQIDVTGTVNLAGSILTLDLGGFVAENGQVFTILSNDGLDATIGTFAGLAEGTIFQFGGQPFRISYVGGSGNDVVLTSVAIQATPSVLMTPTAGSVYGQQVTATGGSGTGYVFTATGLPAGLSISASGLITGTPTTANAVPALVQVTIVDSLGATTTKTYLVSVNTAIVATPATLPAPTVGSPYSQQVSASGGSGGGYTYSATGLPAGLSIDANGLITGTPTSTSPATVLVTITDGDGASTVKTYSVTASRAASATSLSTSPGSTAYGQPVTLTATLTTTASGIGIPTGTVQFFDGETLLGTGTLDGQGVATFTTSALRAGSNAITAVYVGDAKFATSTSASVSPSVSKAESSSSLATSTMTPKLNQLVTLTATVAGEFGGGVGGTVSFFDGTTLLGTAAIDGQGVASLVTAGLGTGAHAITAVFNGDPNLVGSTSPAVTVTITQSQSNAGDVTSSEPRIFYGEGVVLTATFSATVSNGAPMTGTVSFFDGDLFLGTVDLVSLTQGSLLRASGFRAAALTDGDVVSGQASLPTSLLGVGEHVIRAIYSGDANYSAATSETPVSVRVDPTITSTTLTASTTAQGTTLTAVVVVTSPGDPTVAGTVSFFDGATLLGIVPVVDGVAALNVGTLAPGPHAFTATFSGGSNSTAGGSTSTVVTSGVAGTVYLDLNADGVLDPGEPGLPGRAVFADLDGDLTYDVGEPITTTDANGRFSLPDVAPGSAGIFEATTVDASLRYVVDQFQALADGSLAIGVVPISAIAPVPVVPNPFSANPSSDADAAYVQSLYHAVLGRVGGDSEVAGWVAGLASGMTREQVADGFVNSPEHRTNQVIVYYRQFLDRAPDPSSQFWVDSLLAGASEESVVEAFLASPEYQAAHQDPSLFIRDLYLDVLGRQGEESGVAAWEANLASGLGRDSVIDYFVNSPEAIDQMVESFYTSYLRRQPDATSRDWVTMLEMPNPSATDVAVGFLSSEEFYKMARRGR